MDQVGVEATGLESFTNDVDVVCGGPSSLFAVLDDDSISCEDGTDDGPKQIVEGVAVRQVCQQQKIRSIAV